MIYRDGEPELLVPVETQGSGSITFARGLWLEAGGDYRAEIILNLGSGMEIRSAAVPIRVIALGQKVGVGPRQLIEQA